MDIESVREAVRLLSGRWELDVMVTLHSRPCGHAELARALGTDGKQLSRVLRRLQKSGLILRSVKTDTPPVRVQYRLTGAGIRLFRLASLLGSWREMEITPEDLLVRALCSTGADGQSNVAATP